jgi:UDP-N-acetylglucosamine/UDP-N-acetylgalactosamine diphosphorylase
MAAMPSELRERLQSHGQEHLLAWWERFDAEQRDNLVRELTSVNLEELRALHAKREQKDALPERERIQPLPRPEFEDDDETSNAGVDAIAEGRVAYLVVAGGQGTRLGFDQPKGMFPIDPISRKPLFQIHAEKVLALHRNFGVRIPFLVMTSPATDAATRLYFKRKNYFRLPPQDVWFFCQGTMPAVDLHTGRLLLEAPGHLCLSPNGHGGTITGLAESGLLDQLGDLGIDTIYYFQVDNPLVNLADFVFIGRHCQMDAEVSSKVLPKTGPTEKVGNFVLVDGRCSMIEYSDLPDDWAHETDDSGQLKFWAGNPAIHLFDVDFLRKLTEQADRLPWHLARKKVPHLDESGQFVQPKTENALKFERFIFDALPQAERWTVLPTARADEFGPVKNKEGTDSPATAQQMLCDQAARWLGNAGIVVPDGIRVEISPLFALDAEEVQTRAQEIPPITRNTYLREPAD